MWVIWNTRNSVVFDNAAVSGSKTMHHIKSTIWQWLNMSPKAMELREEMQFTDLLHGWRYIMVEER
ncbi:hypothetical protein FRX31_018517 [Thalictrum thalictroides]|uniref:Uncharacterized protein n=1 Tax=Thalictrum thalictroides TaxID=46969 RepID=A0A7J6W3E6_THATH|nr:hypothetical protein FRX31_018517 [Thalictrum thalictroides]